MTSPGSRTAFANGFLIGCTGNNTEATWLLAADWLSGSNKMEGISDSSKKSSNINAVFLDYYEGMAILIRHDRASSISLPISPTLRCVYRPNVAIEATDDSTPVSDPESIHFIVKVKKMRQTLKESVSE